MAVSKSSKKGTTPKLQPAPNRIPTLSQKSSEVNLAKTRVYRCLQCGAESLRPNDKFFTSPRSWLYKENDKYVPICKQCLRSLYRQILEKYDKDVCFTIMVCCHILDWPYDPATARLARDAEPSFPLSDYHSRITVPKFHGLTFADTMKPYFDNPIIPVEARKKQERNWDRESIQNMAYIKNIFGYDPFDDEALTSEDRKFLFNTMAGYCPDSSVGSDSHKLQSIMNIVRLQLHAHKVDEQMTEALAQNPINVKAIDSYTKIQKDLYASINSMAKENAISASGSGGVKTANTLTERMRLLADEKFEDIEVNMFNIKQSAIIQQVADISTQSIIKELHFEDNDYSDIITQQRDIITEQEKKLDELREELRLAENELIQRKIDEQNVKKELGES